MTIDEIIADLTEVQSRKIEAQSRKIEALVRVLGRITPGRDHPGRELLIQERRAALCMQHSDADSSETLIVGDCVRVKVGSSAYEETHGIEGTVTKVGKEQAEVDGSFGRAWFSTDSLEMVKPRPQEAQSRPFTIEQPRDMRCPDCGKMMTNHIIVTRHEESDGAGRCDEAFHGPPLSLPECSYMGGREDPRKCNSSRCPRHGMPRQQRSDNALQEPTSTEKK